MTDAYSTRPNLPSLPPDVFEALVSALANALVHDYRARWSGAVAAPTVKLSALLPCG